MSRLADFIYKRLGPDWCGMPAPPPHKVLYFQHDQGGNVGAVASTHPNDGAEVWLGTMNRWHCFYRMRDARRLAWWILWDVWAVGSWFGLRRALWYWALNVRCKRHEKKMRPAGTPAPERGGRTSGPSAGGAS